MLMECDIANTSLYAINHTNCTTKPTMPVYCDEDTRARNTIFAVYLFIVLILTIAGNSLVIIVVLMYERLRQITNFFLVSLATADLLFALLSLPFNIYQTLNNGHWCGSLQICTLHLIVDTSASAASMSNLAAVSFDRLIAICKPFRYSDIISKKKSFLVILIVWIYGLFWGIIQLVPFGDYPEPHIVKDTVSGRGGCRNEDRVFFTCAAILVFFFPLLVVICSYSIIFRVAVTQAKAVAALDPNRNRRKRTTFFREVKATKVIALVIGAFVVCWLPVFVIQLAATWDPENTYKFSVNYPNAYLFVYWTFLRALPPLNSCMNPFIYCLFNANFRSSFAKFLHLPQRRPREMDHTMVTTDTTYNERPYSTVNENGI